MAYIFDGRVQDGNAAVDRKTKALRVTDAPRGAGYAVSGTSGTIAAAAAAGSLFWSIRNGSANTNLLVFVEKLRLQVAILAAFTTANVAGRRLSLYRGSAAAPTGGTALTPVSKDSTSAVSQVASANGGDARIATTGALSVTNINWEASPFREMSLSHMNTAGANNEDQYDFSVSAPIVLQSGQLLGVRVSPAQAMDAGGTFLISVDCDYHESVAWSSSVTD